MNITCLAIATLIALGAQPAPAAPTKPAAKPATDAASAGWPRFRGPGNDGKSNDTGLRVSGDKPLQFIWEAFPGAAFSSFAAAGDNAFTCGTKDDNQVLYSLSVETGKTRWSTTIEPAYRNSHGDGTRATPTLDDGTVYILGAHGTLLAADAETGKKVWSTSFQSPPTWGYSASVLIEGDLAISTAGLQEGAVLALDKKTGEVKWRCGSDPAGYATPYPFTFEGKRYVVAFTGEAAIVAEINSGELALRIPWETAWQVNAAAPIFHDGYLFLSSGYRTGAGLYQLKHEGATLKATEIWKSRVLLNKFQSCILDGAHLYTSDQRALHCVEFLTGREIWNVNRLKHGTLVHAQDHLFFLTQDGELQVGKASPVGFEPTLRAGILSGRCWSVPVIHQQRLLARSLDRVVCFDLAVER